MANATEPFAKSIKGMNPQNLVEKILRNRIYSCRYWKEECFGLTEESLVDKAIELEYIGGTFGGNQQPTPFLCLVLKLLQLQPDLDIIEELIQNEDYKYVTALGMIYYRLIGKAVEIHKKLEPLYNDYRKLRRRKTIGWELLHMDEFIHELLHEEYTCDILLPRMPERLQLEQAGLLTIRRSILEDEEEEQKSL